MLQVETQNGTTVVRVRVSRLDYHCAAEFQEEFETVVDGVSGLILLDLSQVQFVDSSGIAAIVYCFNLFEIRESLALCGLQPKVKQTFEFTKLGEILKIYPDVQSALEV